MRYCGQCGSPNTDTARFCTNCGVKLSEPTEQIDIVQNEQYVNEDVNVNCTEAVKVSETGTVTREPGYTSALSIIGFIFAFLLPVAGLIMGIIDLCMNDNRNKGLSIAAVVISACFIAIFVVTMLTIVVPISAMFGIM